jgi:hypothetical protein
VLSEVKSSSKLTKSPKNGENNIFRNKARDKEMHLFREIFVQPKEDILKTIKTEIKNIKDEDSKKQEKILKIYQEKEMRKFKIFEEKNPDEALEKMREITMKPDNYEIYNKSLLKKISNRTFKQEKDDRLAESMSLKEQTQKRNAMELLSQSMILEDSQYQMSTPKDDKMIFHQQIQVEPPDFPNAHSSSPVAPGLGWAPSIPFIVEDESRISLKDLLIRANAGMKAGEVQEEAHLSFYLGVTYENKKLHQKVFRV